LLMSAAELKRCLRGDADSKIAEHSQRFFKTGPGEYGEGDKFLGLRVPLIRAHAKRFRELPHSAVTSLLHSSYHEERLCALIILVNKFAKADELERQAIFELYLANTAFINNWDLVDLSAPQIVGGYLSDRSRKVLKTLVKSKSLWERRIAMLACLHFIRERDFNDALQVAEALLDDPEDLIHKAVGWMLREIGKRDLDAERAFLQPHYKTMPRTMLRYAIEKFPEDLRQAYLHGTA